MKTSELSGAALDWAVAKCEIDMLWIGEQAFCSDEYGNDGRSLFTPSTDWAQGGPIISREGITLRCGLHCWDAELPEFKVLVDGANALEAAMRCYVASKLGDEVTIPEEVK